MGGGNNKLTALPRMYMSCVNLTRFDTDTDRDDNNDSDSDGSTKRKHAPCDVVGAPATVAEVEDKAEGKAEGRRRKHCHLRDY